MKSCSVLALSFVLLNVQQILQDVNGKEDLKLTLHEFEPCEDHEDSKFVIKDVDWTKVNKTTTQINSTIVLKDDLDDSFTVEIKLTTCPEGTMNNCEENPPIFIKDGCGELIGQDKIFSAIFENAEGLEDKKCPIPKGTYTSSGTYNTLESPSSASKLICDEGHYQIDVNYYLDKEVIGCQHIEAILEPDSRKSKKH